MSSDHLWQRFFSRHYPSLANLTNATKSTAVSYYKLYSLGHASEKRRVQPPPKPDLSLKLDKNGSIFRFDAETNKSVGFEALNGLKITWNVVLEGFRSVFTMMDCEGEGSFVMGLEGWFSKELPSAGCCSGGGAASELAVELRVELRESGGKVVVENMSLGVLSTVSWICVR